ncbi:MULTISPECIES: KPN_01571 family protein [Enterobacter]
MNPFYWVILVVLTLDAVRELMGASSVMGIFS